MQVAHWMGREEYVSRVQSLIRCAVSYFPVEGGADFAIRVADCESSLYPWSTNGSNLGAYQISSWETRAREYLEPRWFPRTWIPPWSNARANVLAGIRWAHLSGWSAWTCARLVG